MQSINKQSYYKLFIKNWIIFLIFVKSKIFLVLKYFKIFFFNFHQNELQLYSYNLKFVCTVLVNVFLVNQLARRRRLLSWILICSIKSTFYKINFFWLKRRITNKYIVKKFIKSSRFTDFTDYIYFFFSYWHLD